MTIQTNDTIFRKKIAFELVGGSGSGLFDVKNLGFTPKSPNTACWRGYSAEYSILDKKLFLTAFQVWFPLGYKDPNAAAVESATNDDYVSCIFADDDLPDPNRALNIPLFGVLPKKGKEGGCFYKGFRKPIQFTGQLVLGYGLVVPPFFRGGWRPCNFGIVRELTFKKGHVTTDKSISAKMAKERAEHVRRQAEMNVVAPTNTKANQERTRALLDKMFPPFD